MVATELTSMRFENLPRDIQLALSLDIAEERAKLGKPSSFERWWYFDTNCLSELVKLFNDGYANQVGRFLGGKEILLSSTVLEELRNAPTILASLENALESATPYLGPDLTRFWYTDIFNFLNTTDPVEFNSLDVFAIPDGFLADLTGKYKDEFDRVCSASERNVSALYHQRVSPDVGGALDERDLCVYIWHIVNRHAQEWFNLEILVADCWSYNFPSFYAFAYAYYFRYVKNVNIKVDLNDFFDLANCIAAPYCEVFFCEASFASILRNNVQGREPPTALQLVKKMYKRGDISRSVYDDARRKRESFTRTSPLLPSVKIVTFAEMRSQIMDLPAA